MTKYESNILKLAKHCGTKYVKKGCDGVLLAFYDEKESDVGAVILKNKKDGFEELELDECYDIDDLLKDEQLLKEYRKMREREKRRER